ncbi:putative wd40 repeat protein [Monocercomonoides exilis]|uniref:putative wd40 repeat protein n=1 Tax=Monocercomonoides exilis TaxID=2049356 RepID=UPI003559F953|nr:putative wd40 repeat protein [Monocercomonoides exilis]|eukprot:MONOS_5489.1-p1 / transcript=MONOS_5489.1 / gene=MONOS_5489 / organism=Monocercomonoides_exilis_PA203 / gene_product=AGAP007731-PA / transcript_product=AGAP007731-PA / location=Mono_scaffold00160:76488-91957(-) / protein_length=4997 / sequence_SO=supercontig / SO=protein_coding / is_pseudo=false
MLSDTVSFGNPLHSSLIGLSICGMGEDCLMENSIEKFDEKCTERNNELFKDSNREKRYEIGMHLGRRWGGSGASSIFVNRVFNDFSNSDFSKRTNILQTSSIGADAPTAEGTTTKVHLVSYAKQRVSPFAADVTQNESTSQKLNTRIPSTEPPLVSSMPSAIPLQNQFSEPTSLRSASPAIGREHRTSVEEGELRISTTLGSGSGAVAVNTLPMTTIVKGSLLKSKSDERRSSINTNSSSGTHFAINTVSEKMRRKAKASGRVQSKQISMNTGTYFAGTGTTLQSDSSSKEQISPFARESAYSGQTAPYSHRVSDASSTSFLIQNQEAETSLELKSSGVSSLSPSMNSTIQSYTSSKETNTLPTDPSPLSAISISSQVHPQSPMNQTLAPTDQSATLPSVNSYGEDTHPTAFPSSTTSHHHLHKPFGMLNRWHEAREGRKTKGKEKIWGGEYLKMIPDLQESKRSQSKRANMLSTGAVSQASHSVHSSALSITPSSYDRSADTSQKVLNTLWQRASQLSRRCGDGAEGYDVRAVRVEVVLIQVLRSLQRMHKIGYAYGELNTRNVYVSKRGWRVKLRRTLRSFASRKESTENQSDSAEMNTKKGVNETCNPSNNIVIIRGIRYKSPVLSLSEAWGAGKIDNFTYLLGLNHLAGRSLNGDPAAHPAFPWVIWLGYGREQESQKRKRRKRKRRERKIKFEKKENKDSESGTSIANAKSSREQKEKEENFDKDKNNESDYEEMEVEGRYLRSFDEEKIWLLKWIKRWERWKNRRKLREKKSENEHLKNKQQKEEFELQRENIMRTDYMNEKNNCLLKEEMEEDELSELNEWDVSSSSEEERWMWRDLKQTRWRMARGDEQLDEVFNGMSGGANTSGADKNRRAFGMKVQFNQNNSAYSDTRDPYLSIPHVILTQSPESGTGSSSVLPLPHHTPDLLSDHALLTYTARQQPIALLERYVRSPFTPSEYPQTISALFENTPEECIPEFFDADAINEESTLFHSLHRGTERGCVEVNQHLEGETAQTAQQSSKTLPDLQPPSWCEGDPLLFLYIHRCLLESDYVSEALHHWIDHTFGYLISDTIAGIGRRTVCGSISSEVPRSGPSGGGFVQLFGVPHPARREFGWKSQRERRRKAKEKMKRYLEANKKLQKDSFNKNEIEGALKEKGRRSQSNRGNDSFIDLLQTSNKELAETIGENSSKESFSSSVGMSTIQTQKWTLFKNERGFEKGFEEEEIEEEINKNIIEGRKMKMAELEERKERLKWLGIKGKNAKNTQNENITKRKENERDMHYSERNEFFTQKQQIDKSFTNDSVQRLFGSIEKSRDRTFSRLLQMKAQLPQQNGDISNSENISAPSAASYRYSIFHKPSYLSSLLWDHPFTHIHQQQTPPTHSTKLPPYLMFSVDHFDPVCFQQKSAKANEEWEKPTVLSESREKNGLSSDFAASHFHPHEEPFTKRIHSEHVQKFLADAHRRNCSLTTPPDNTSEFNLINEKSSERNPSSFSKTSESKVSKHSQTDREIADDIFAFGCLWAELILGMPAFSSYDAKAPSFHFPLSLDYSALLNSSKKSTSDNRQTSPLFVFLPSNQPCPSFASALASLLSALKTRTTPEVVSTIASCLNPNPLLRPTSEELLEKEDIFDEDTKRIVEIYERVDGVFTDDVENSKCNEDEKKGKTEQFQLNKPFGNERNEQSKPQSSDAIKLNDSPSTDCEPVVLGSSQKLAESNTHKESNSLEEKVSQMACQLLMCSSIMFEMDQAHRSFLKPFVLSFFTLSHFCSSSLQLIPFALRFFGSSFLRSTLLPQLVLLLNTYLQFDQMPIGLCALSPFVETPVDRMIADLRIKENRRRGVMRKERARRKSFLRKKAEKERKELELNEKTGTNQINTISHFSYSNGYNVEENIQLASSSASPLHNEIDLPSSLPIEKLFTLNHSLSGGDQIATTVFLSIPSLLSSMAISSYSFWLGADAVSSVIVPLLENGLTQTAKKLLKFAVEEESENYKITGSRRDAKEIQEEGNKLSNKSELHLNEYYLTEESKGNNPPNPSSYLCSQKTTQQLQIASKLANVRSLFDVHMFLGSALATLCATLPPVVVSSSIVPFLCNFHTYPFISSLLLSTLPRLSPSSVSSFATLLSDQLERHTKDGQKVCVESVSLYLSLLRRLSASRVVNVLFSRRSRRNLSVFIDEWIMDREEKNKERMKISGVSSKEEQVDENDKRKKGKESKEKEKNENSRSKGKDTERNNKKEIPKEVKGTKREDIFEQPPSDNDLVRMMKMMNSVEDAWLEKEEDNLKGEFKRYANMLRDEYQKETCIVQPDDRKALQTTASPSSDKLDFNTLLNSDEKSTSKIEAMKESTFPTKRDEKCDSSTIAIPSDSILQFDKSSRKIEPSSLSTSSDSSSTNVFANVSHSSSNATSSNILPPEALDLPTKIPENQHFSIGAQMRLALQSSPLPISNASNLTQTASEAEVESDSEFNSINASQIGASLEDYKGEDDNADLAIDGSISPKPKRDGFFSIYKKKAKNIDSTGANQSQQPDGSQAGTSISQLSSDSESLIPSAQPVPPESRSSTEDAAASIAQAKNIRPQPPRLLLPSCIPSPSLFSDRQVMTLTEKDLQSSAFLSFVYSPSDSYAHLLDSFLKTLEQKLDRLNLPFIFRLLIDPFTCLGDSSPFLLHLSPHALAPEPFAHVSFFPPSNMSALSSLPSFNLFSIETSKNADSTFASTPFQKTLDLLFLLIQLASFLYDVSPSSSLRQVALLLFTHCFAVVVSFPALPLPFFHLCAALSACLGLSDWCIAFETLVKLKTESMLEREQKKRLKEKERKRMIAEFVELFKKLKSEKECKDDKICINDEKNIYEQNVHETYTKFTRHLSPFYSAFYFLNVSTSQAEALFEDSFSEKSNNANSFESFLPLLYLFSNPALSSKCISSSAQFLSQHKDIQSAQLLLPEWVESRGVLQNALIAMLKVNQPMLRHTAHRLIPTKMDAATSKMNSSASNEDKTTHSYAFNIAQITSFTFLSIVPPPLSPFISAASIHRTDNTLLSALQAKLRVNIQKISARTILHETDSPQFAQKMNSSDSSSRKFPIDSPSEAEKTPAIIEAPSSPVDYHPLPSSEKHISSSAASSIGYDQPALTTTEKIHVQRKLLRMLEIMSHSPEDVRITLKEEESNENREQNKLTAEEAMAVIQILREKEKVGRGSREGRAILRLLEGSGRERENEKVIIGGKEAIHKSDYAYSSKSKDRDSDSEDESSEDNEENEEDSSYSGSSSWIDSSSYSSSYTSSDETDEGNFDSLAESDEDEEDEEDYELSENESKRDALSSKREEDNTRTRRGRSNMRKSKSNEDVTSERSEHLAVNDSEEKSRKRRPGNKRSSDGNAVQSGNGGSDRSQREQRLRERRFKYSQRRRYRESSLEASGHSSSPSQQPRQMTAKARDEMNLRLEAYRKRKERRRAEFLVLLSNLPDIEPKQFVKVDSVLFGTKGNEKKSLISQCTYSPMINSFSDSVAIKKDTYQWAAGGATITRQPQNLSQSLFNNRKESNLSAQVNQQELNSSSGRLPQQKIQKQSLIQPSNQSFDTSSNSWLLDNFQTTNANGTFQNKVLYTILPTATKRLSSREPLVQHQSESFGSNVQSASSFTNASFQSPAISSSSSSVNSLSSLVPNATNTLQLLHAPVQSIICSPCESFFVAGSDSIRIFSLISEPKAPVAEYRGHKFGSVFPVTDMCWMMGSVFSSGNSRERQTAYRKLQTGKGFIGKGYNDELLDCAEEEIGESGSAFSERFALNECAKGRIQIKSNTMSSVEDSPEPFPVFGEAPKPLYRAVISTNQDTGAKSEAASEKNEEPNFLKQFKQPLKRNCSPFSEMGMHSDCKFENFGNSSSKRTLNSSFSTRAWIASCAGDLHVWDVETQKCIWDGGKAFCQGINTPWMNDDYNERERETMETFSRKIAEPKGGKLFFNNQNILYSPFYSTSTSSPFSPSAQTFASIQSQSYSILRNRVTTCIIPISPDIVAGGGRDGFLRLFDVRSKSVAQSFYVPSLLSTDAERIDYYCSSNRMAQKNMKRSSFCFRDSLDECTKPAVDAFKNIVLERSGVTSLSFGLTEEDSPLLRLLSRNINDDLSVSQSLSTHDICEYYQSNGCLPNVDASEQILSELLKLAHLSGVQRMGGLSRNGKLSYSVGGWGDITVGCTIGCGCGDGSVSIVDGRMGKPLFTWKTHYDERCQQNSQNADALSDSTEANKATSDSSNTFVQPQVQSSTIQFSAYSKGITRIMHNSAGVVTVGADGVVETWKAPPSGFSCIDPVPECIISTVAKEIIDEGEKQLWQGKRETELLLSDCRSTLLELEKEKEERRKTKMMKKDNKIGKSDEKMMEEVHIRKPVDLQNSETMEIKQRIVEVGTTLSKVFESSTSAQQIAFSPDVISPNPTQSSEPVNASSMLSKAIQRKLPEKDDYSRVLSKRYSTICSVMHRYVELFSVTHSNAFFSISKKTPTFSVVTQLPSQPSLEQFGTSSLCIASTPSPSNLSTYSTITHLPSTSQFPTKQFISQPSIANTKQKGIAGSPPSVSQLGLSEAGDRITSPVNENQQESFSSFSSIDVMSPSLISVASTFISGSWGFGAHRGTPVKVNAPVVNRAALHTASLHIPTSLTLSSAISSPLSATSNSTMNPLLSANSDIFSELTLPTASIPVNSKTVSQPIVPFLIARNNTIGLSSIPIGMSDKVSISMRIMHLVSILQRISGKKRVASLGMDGIEKMIIEKNQSKSEVSEKQKLEGQTSDNASKEMDTKKAVSKVQADLQKLAEEIVIKEKTRIEQQEMKEMEKMSRDALEEEQELIKEEEAFLEELEGLMRVCLRLCDEDANSMNKLIEELEQVKNMRKELNMKSTVLINEKDERMMHFEEETLHALISRLTSFLLKYYSSPLISNQKNELRSDADFNYDNLKMNTTSEQEISSNTIPRISKHRNIGKEPETITVNITLKPVPQTMENECIQSVCAVPCSGIIIVGWSDGTIRIMC